jgi:hypothetical protein
MHSFDHLRIKTRQVTLAASFAAVYFVLRTIPTFQMVGISGRFSAADFLLTAIAILCGLWGGVLSVVIGTVLAYGLSPPIFFGLDFLPAIADVAIAALLIKGRCRTAQGMYLAIFFAFVLSPYSLRFGYGYVPYTWLHIVALIALLSPIASKIPAWLNGHGYRQIAAIGTLAFVGTMGQHLVGGLLYELAVGVVGGVSPSILALSWRIIFLAYPIERLLIVGFSMIVALAVQRSLKKWLL